MMHRRNFIASIGLGIPAICLAQSCSVSKKDDVKSSLSAFEHKALMAMLSMQRASWEQGVAMHAISEAGLDELVVQMAQEACLRNNDDGRLGMQGSRNNVTDPVSNGIGVLRAFEITGDSKFKQASEKLFSYCKTLAPKAPNGALYHLINAPVVWSDSIYMAPPFLAAMGDFDEAIKQLDGYREYLWDKDLQLYHHRYNVETQAFENIKFWGGGNGWAIAAYAMIIDMLPNEMMQERERLIDHFILLAEGLMNNMRPDGLFYDVINDSQSFVETNVSQMLAYALFKGIQSGWLGKRYLKTAQELRKAALSKIDQYGLVQDACGSPGFDHPGTSTEAQAFFLLMESAFRKM